MVSAFAMVGTFWSVSCLLFFTHGAPRALPFVKVGARAPSCRMESAPLIFPLCLCQIFHSEIIQQNRAFQYFPADVVPQMFCNVKSIFQFHHDFLLPQLEQRMATWFVRKLV